MSRRLPITLDISDYAVVVLCSRCGPSWRGAARDTADGYLVAEDHATRVHGDRDLAAVFRGRRVAHKNL